MNDATKTDKPLSLNDCKQALQEAISLCDIGDTAAVLRWIDRAKAIVQVHALRAKAAVPTVHHEPMRFAKCPAENCVICRKPTRTWLTPHAPLCSVCATEPIYRCRACQNFWKESSTRTTPEGVRTCYDAMCGGTCDLQQPVKDETAYFG